jgi:CelD/BcsL family acetyltransferase involved in cellulose biosynthesis
VAPADDGSASAAPHSAEFVARWRDVVARTLRLPVEHGCIRMRGLLGGTTLSYLPFLNYTDLTPRGAAALVRELGSRPYHVRVLDPAGTAFAHDDPVTLRLDLAGRDADAVWRRGLDAKCRNQVRKAQRSGLTLRRGGEPALADAFHALLASTLHRHGAPLLPRRLLYALASELGARFCIASRAGTPIAGLVEIHDRDLVWVPWAASERSALDLCPNHLTYWTTIEDAVGAGRRVFDFGRSPFGGATHRFKEQWGARPVALRLLSSQPADVYARYALAQRVWRGLPRPLVDRLGPWLCRHLPDY